MGAGQTAHVHDLGTGAPVRRYEPQERADSALASMQVEGTRDGRLLFAGECGRDLSVCLYSLCEKPIMFQFDPSQSTTRLCA